MARIGNRKGVLSQKSIIKSIHPFEITIATSATSGTQTIPSVDTTRTAIFFGGFTTSNTTSTHRESLARAELTNATTITAYRDTASATHTVVVRGMAVEFEEWAVDKVQNDTVVIGSNVLTGTKTIANSNTGRTALVYLGHTYSSTSTSIQAAMGRFAQTDATTITATRGTANSGVVTMGFSAIEFAQGIVKQIQQRIVTFANSQQNNTDAISPVNLKNTFLLYNGVSSTSSAVNVYLYALDLESTTQVTLRRLSSSSSSRTVSYLVIELEAGFIAKMQRKVTTISSVTSVDESTTFTSAKKTVCSFLNMNSDGSSTDERWCAVKRLNSKNLRLLRATAGSTTSDVGVHLISFH